MTTYNMQAPVGLTGLVQAAKSGLTYTLDANGRANIDIRDVSDLASQGWSLTFGGQPPGIFTTGALQTAVIPAASLVGGDAVFYENTGVTPGTLTTDTAAAILALMPGAFVGYGWEVTIRNSSSGANTATIAGGTGVTMQNEAASPGTQTIAQHAARRYLMKVTGIGASAAITMISQGLFQAAA